MGKKDTRTPQQRRADRARLREWTQEQGIELKTFEDVQELFKDFVAMTLEGGLEIRYNKLRKFRKQKRET